MTSTREAAIESLRIDSPPVTLREMALDRIREAIVAGTFEPGNPACRTDPLRPAGRFPLGHP